MLHCVSNSAKSLYWVEGARLRSFSGLYFPAFGLNTDKGIWMAEYGRKRTEKTRNTEIFTQCHTFSAYLVHTFCKN